MDFSPHRTPRAPQRALLSEKPMRAGYRRLGEDTKGPKFDAV
jgi:hypothetical protein